MAVLLRDERRRLDVDAGLAASSRLLVPETWAALARAELAGRVDLRAAAQAVEERLRRVAFVELTPQIAGDAGRLARAHGLRGHDAVHLASALALEDEGLVLATWDDELAAAAAARGLATAGATQG